jgi:8-oxo-dGTP pyrophosphatase MutT (NUDIX family)
LRRELEDPKKLPLTVGRVVILNSEGEIALLRRANSSRPETNGFWELPGGKRDPGEGSLQGIVREAREETGLWIDPKTGLTVIYSKDMTGGDRHGQKLINLACVAQVVAGELTFDPQEASAAQWVTRDGLSEMHGADQLRPMTLETVDYFLRAA